MEMHFQNVLIGLWLQWKIKKQDLRRREIKKEDELNENRESGFSLGERNAVEGGGSSYIGLLYCCTQGFSSMPC